VRQWRALIGVGLSILLLAIGCSKPQESSTPAPAQAPSGSQSQQASTSGPKRGGTLVVGGDFGPQSLDPHLTVAWASVNIYEHIYEGLLRWTADNKIEPALATKWEVSPDGKIYTFTIRKGVKFHNGREMTADDVKFSFDRILDPKTGSPNMKNFEPIDKVEVVDPYTVRFTLKRVFSPFLPYLATVNYSAIVPKEEVAALATKPVGTGPFKWAEYIPDQHVKLARNEQYWESGKPYLDAIVLKLIPDDGAQVSALRSKTTQMTWLKDPKVAQNVVKSNPGLVSFPGQTTRYIDIKFKLDQPPFNDVRVRRAVSLAIDRQALVDIVLGGFGTVGTFIPGPPFAHPNPKGLPYYKPDLEKAKALLAEAGATNLNVEWKVVAANSLDVQAAEVVKEQLAKVGITVKINAMEVGQLLNDWNAGNYTMGSVGTVWSPDPDVDAFSRYHSSTAFAKGQGLNDKELDQYLEKARTTTSEAERKDAYVKAQERLADQAYQIVLYTYPLRWELTWNNVKGYKPTPANSRVYLRETWLD
jgi:peptide/nickel transport system substrate-binding protein